MSIILGIDPGLATTGIGVISVEGSKHTLIHYGTILTPAKQPLHKRLYDISLQFQNTLDQFQPDTIAIEDLFFSKNKKTALLVAQARGIYLALSARAKRELFVYTPPEIKLSVCGYGAATKQQVQYMVKSLLNMDHIPKPDDAADALAICICHAHSHKIKKFSKLTIR